MTNIDIKTGKELNTEKESFYLTRLAQYPKIFVDTKKAISIGNAYKDTYPIYAANGEIVGQQEVEITGKNFLRSNDDDVFYGIIQAHINHGALDSINFEEIRQEKLEGKSLKYHIDKVRRVETSLVEIAQVLNKNIRTEGLRNIVDSLIELAAISISSTRLYFKNGSKKDFDEPESINKQLIGEFSFSKTRSTREHGYIMLSDSVAEDLILGRILPMDAEAYAKLPAGRPRKFFRYLHYIFQHADSKEMDLDELYFDILGGETQDRELLKNENLGAEERKTINARMYRTYNRFKELCIGLSNQYILEQGFDSKSEKTYDLYYSKDGQTKISLRKGLWFYDKEKYPIPSATTIKRQGTLQKLKDFSLNSNMHDVYVRACSQNPIQGVVENERNPGKDTKTYSLSPNGFYVTVTPVNGNEEYTKEVELDWDKLEDFMDYANLYKKYSPDGAKYSRSALILRNVVEKGMYNVADHESLKAKAKEILKSKGKDKMSPEAIKAKEQEELNDRERELKEAEARREFITLSNPYKLSLEDEYAKEELIQRIEPKTAMRKTWFSKCRYYLNDQILIIIAHTPMNKDWVDRKYLSKLKAMVSSKLTHVKDVIVEMEEDASYLFKCADESKSGNSEASVDIAIPDYYGQYKNPANTLLVTIVLTNYSRENNDCMSKEDIDKVGEFLRNKDVPHKVKSLEYFILAHRLIQEELSK